MDVDDHDEYMNAAAAHAAFVMTVSAARMYWLLRHAQHTSDINIHKLQPLLKQSAWALTIFCTVEHPFYYCSVSFCDTLIQKFSWLFKDCLTTCQGLLQPLFGGTMVLQRHGGTVFDRTSTVQFTAIIGTAIPQVYRVSVASYMLIIARPRLHDTTGCQTRCIV